ncbi:hypothetical protein HON58_03825, partial [Candidatus Peregrinibacteria bacterium]|nr:hypothetical protein [Candidatus Peregrinibacteria bacterium]
MNGLKKILLGGVLALVFACVGPYVLMTSPVAYAALITWDGGAGDGLWNSANNWSGDVVPTQWDAVYIGSPTTSYTVQVAGGQIADFDTLTIGGALMGNTARLYLYGNIGTGTNLRLDAASTVYQMNNVQQTLWGELWILDGGTLKHGNNSTTQAYEVDFSVATFTVDAGGTIDVDDLGYDKGEGPAPGTYVIGNAGGGGHGGNGGNGNQAGSLGGIAYCSSTNPATMGSGGGHGNGGAGGGIVMIEVSGTATINGEITADGGWGGASSGGGAGGGVKITANTIAGTPSSFTAVGGEAVGYPTSYWGGGGGGCIYLGYVTSNSISSATVTGGISDYDHGDDGTFLAPDSCTSSGSEGDWNTAGTWDNCGGTVPQAGEDVSISHAVTIGDYTINAVDNITIASGGTLTQNNDDTQTLTGTLTVESGGTLTHGDHAYVDGDSQLYEVDFSAANITIEDGGAVDVDGLGHEGGGHSQDGNGTGGGFFATYADGSGGGHHGNGGMDVEGDAGGVGYMSIYDPSTLGSGGGGGGCCSLAGGDGGGLVILQATGTIDISGTITADGTSGIETGGGGAGGGIKLVADIITNTDAVDDFSVIGGNGGSYGAGGGGGGGVYIEFTTSNSIASSDIDHYGGAKGGSAEDGGAGIVAIYDTDSGDSASLYSDNGARDGATSTQAAASVTAKNIDLQNNAEYTIPSGGSLTLNDPDNSPVENGDGTGIIRVTEGTLYANATLTIQDAILEMHQTGTLSGVSTLNITGTDAGEMGYLDLRYFTSSLAFSIATLNLNAYSMLTHGENTEGNGEHAVNVSATTININADAEVDVDGRGHQGSKIQTTDGFGPAAGVYGGYASGTGAGHGGDGGNDTDGDAGTAADVDIANIATFGSGGGGRGSALSGNGGDGGGLVILTASGTLDIDGTITADGDAGTDYAGGGAGGGVKLVADSITGDATASISADGGLASVGHGAGAGGGGAVSVEYTTTLTANISCSSISALGGAGYADGGAGPIYIVDTDGDSGDICVDNGSNTGGTSTQYPSSVTAARIKIVGDNKYVVPSGKTLVLDDSDNAPFFSGDGTGTLSIEAGGVLTPNATLIIDDTELEFYDTATLNNATTLTLNGTNGSIKGTLELYDYTSSSAFSIATLNINAYGMLTHGENTEDNGAHVVNVSSTDINITANGSVDVDGRGHEGGGRYEDGYGDGGGVYGTYASGAGGGHGGHGGTDDEEDAGGISDIDITNISTLGSGGAGWGCCSAKGG